MALILSSRRSPADILWRYGPPERRTKSLDRVTSSCGGAEASSGERRYQPTDKCVCCAVVRDTSQVSCSMSPSTLESVWAGADTESESAMTAGEGRRRRRRRKLGLERKPGSVGEVIFRKHPSKAFSYLRRLFGKTAAGKSGVCVPLWKSVRGARGGKTSIVLCVVCKMGCT